uniref:Uncharacterized protein n=1 Tax=Arundo donax TaxID=35708 RepID=A0A0A9CFB2_ARUDO
MLCSKNKVPSLLSNTLPTLLQHLL